MVISIMLHFKKKKSHPSFELCRLYLGKCFFFFEQFSFNMSYSPKHSIPMLSEAIFGHWLEGRHEVSLYIQVAICFFPMKVQNHRQPCTSHAQVDFVINQKISVGEQFCSRPNNLVVNAQLNIESRTLQA